MKKLLIGGFILIAFIVSAPTIMKIQPAFSQKAVLAVGAGTNKVTICHIPPGNPANAHSDTVGAPAVPAHIRDHGDYLGACHH